MLKIDFQVSSTGIDGGSGMAMPELRAGAADAVARDVDL